MFSLKMEKLASEFEWEATLIELSIKVKTMGSQ